MKTRLIIVLFTSFLNLCLGDYKFEVLLESYENPSHKLADGTCCNNPNRYNRCGRIRAVCDNQFTFCVRPYEYGSTKMYAYQSCPKSGAIYTTSVITDDKISFKDDQHLNYVTNLSNPLVFYGRIWPGQVQLYIQVQNWEMFGNQPIDNVLQIWSLPVSSSYSASKTFSSEKDRVTITARARVMCTGGYYGPYCSTFCGVEGCNPVRATCPKEKECVCLPGYSGQSCESTGKNTTQSNATITSPDDDGDRTVTDTLSGETMADENATKILSLDGGGREIGGLSIGANGSGGSNTGKVAGGVIGGLICLALLSAIVIVCLWFGKKKIAERKAFRDSNNQEYQATIESPQLVSSSYSGTYRVIDNNLYTQVPTSEDRGGWDESEGATDLTISEAATASSDTLVTTKSVEDRRNPVYVNRTTSQYSLVQRRDSDASSCHSEEEIEGGERGAVDGIGRGEGQSASKPPVSQYSVITRENMEYLSEASDSEEDSHTHSDAELVKDGGRDGGHTSSDFDPRRDGGEQHAIRLYENIIPYS